MKRIPGARAVRERESDIQRAIRDYLRLMGWFVWHNLQSLGSYRGLADLTAVKDGTVLFIEVKTSRGRLTQHQERFKDHLTRAGGHYVVARSIDDVEEAIKQLEEAER
ncbi:VRR-NUC domain-containing protein [Candidatus Darwinibacter acetoxidans]